MSLISRMSQMPYLLLVFPPLFWAGNAVLARGVVGVVPPVSLAYFRWLFAFLIILPFGLRYAMQDWPLVREKWLVVVALGFLGITCFNSMLYVSAQTTTSINIAVLQTFMPAVVILFSLAFLQETVTRVQWLGVGISTVGAIMIVSSGNPLALFSKGLVAGDGIMLTAVVLYALYSVILRFRPEIHALSLLVYTFASGIIMLTPFYLWELSTVGGFTVTAGVATSFVYLAICPSVLAYLCWNQGVKLAGPNRAGLFINLLPVFAAILAVLLLGETVKWYHLVGMALVFAGMLLFNRR